MAESYPIAIVEDRYGDVYSGGRWLAIANATDMVSGSETRMAFCLESDVGPHGSDIDAGMFWTKPPAWIAVGSTPDEALEHLRNSLT